MNRMKRAETIAARKPLLLVCGLVLAACASSPPPRQLLDARAAYNRARIGKAAQHTPADLHTAKVALTAAEKAYEDDAESPETFALSYVALRTAQLVESKANTKAAEADIARFDDEYRKLHETEVARTRGELAAARKDLKTTSQQLDAERKAREQYEQRYQEAMRKLAEAAALNVKEEPRGTVIVLPGEVLFATGKSELTAIAQQKLTLIAGTLSPQAEEHDIVVEGHTDSRGSRDFNMQLSLSRAQSVMNYLVSRGVAAESITSTGIGPDRPLADNNSRDGRQQNRRVEIIVKPREKR
jgi:outer membrane protein OmpA-like peptidoglycan-associated protein